MSYRPERVGEASIRESARLRAEEGDKRAAEWLERSRGHKKRQRAEARRARQLRRSRSKIK